jgi:hypothetical protein
VLVKKRLTFAMMPLRSHPQHRDDGLAPMSRASLPLWTILQSGRQTQMNSFERGEPHALKNSRVFHRLS